MSTWKIISTCILSIVIAGSFRPVLGQENYRDKVGSVYKLTDTKGATIPGTQQATLFGPGGQDFVSQNDPLHFRDILQLNQSHLFIDLRFDNLNSRAIMGVSEDGPVQQVGAKGSYEIRRDTSLLLNTLQLVVRQGTMVVQHLSGQLQAVAAGIRTDIIGTTVLFYVDPGDETGYAFLQEGTIRFPDYDMSESGSNRLWQLTRGSPPVEIFLSSSKRKDWNKEVKYHTENVWKVRRPFFKRPGVYVGAGVGVAAAILLLQNKPQETREGSVTINLPN